MKQAAKFLIQKLPLRVKLFFISLFENSLSNKERLGIGRNNTFLSLQRLVSYGYKPCYVIDVGANNGSWTAEVYKIFPDALFIAVEALPDKKIVLEKAFSNMRVKIYNNLLGDSNKKDVPFYSMDTGSSVLNELTSYGRDIIYLNMITLDEIASREGLQGNILLKLDVQGFELEVLKGATSIINSVDIICMEVSFLNYNEGAPLVDEVMQRMKELDFLAYDITGFMRKNNDYALIQADFIFIRSNNQIRQKLNNMKQDFNVVLC